MGFIGKYMYAMQGSLGNLSVNEDFVIIDPSPNVVTKVSKRDSLINSIFNIYSEKTPLTEFKEKLIDLLRDSRITTRISYNVQVKEEKYLFAGRLNKNKSYQIILDVPYSLSWLWSFFKTVYPEEKAKDYLIEDFFKDIEDKQAQQEMIKAAEQGLKIILHLSRANDSPLQLLECILPQISTERSYFSVYNWKKIDRWFFSNKYQKEKCLWDMHSVVGYLFEFQLGANRLAGVRELILITSNKYNNLIGSSYEKEYKIELQKVNFQADNIAKKMKKAASSFFELTSMKSDESTLELEFHLEWKFFLDLFDKGLGKKVQQVSQVFFDTTIECSEHFKKFSELEDKAKFANLVNVEKTKEFGEICNKIKQIFKNMRAIKF